MLQLGAENNAFLHMQKIRGFTGGFALPTVLIASVVMLMVLTVSVSSVVAVRTTLQTQYYEQLAKTAGEAGVAYAKACLAKNGNVPLWTDAKPLTPATDCAGNVLLSPALDVLVVGAGGGGGGTIAGGGGGGGVVQQSGFTIASGADYTVTVGAGGTGGRGWDTSPAGGSSGGNSSFASIVAIGGGGGSGYARALPLVGGSGGGGAKNYTTGALGTAGQGFAGGSHPSNNDNMAGGGGGAGGVGLDSTTTKSGDGGPGIASSITGALTYYGGGGGGGIRSGTGTIGSGGIGGGGNGGTTSTTAAQSGAANTGGGGGGAGHDVGSGSIVGGNGGSGVVVARYPTGSLTATGGTKTDTGVYTVHRFTSSGTLHIDSVGTASCPSDPRCSVMVDGTVRSSFSIGLPTLDTEGKAVAVPNNGYVELLRSSNGQVWRTYRQPSVQAAVVPGLCNGAATSSLGWSNAVVTTSQSSLPSANAARSISLSDTALSAGQVYFRRDFVVNSSGTYTFNASTPSSTSKIELFINGTLVTTAQGSLQSGSIPLTPGCYVATARLTNKTITPVAASFIAALQSNVNGSTPILVSDSDWRVSSGNVVDFSSSEYYADPDLWQPVTDNTYVTVQYANSSWQSLQTDIWTRFVSLASGGCPGSCPGPSFGFLRDSRDVVLTANTEVLVSALCDDNCIVYIDGSPVITGVPWSTITQQTITLGPGSHRVGVRVYNGGVGASGVGVSLVDRATGAILTRTDYTWVGTNTWYASAPANPTSYETSYIPSPSEIIKPTTIDTLIVAGGGGGGGNCSSCGGAGGGGGGGVIYNTDVPITAGGYPITVGGGGAGGTAGGTAGGANGSNSNFMGLTAIGGGGGMGQNATNGKNGGSGGGGSGGGSPAPGGGGLGTSGQGYGGGAGLTSPYGGGGGGGATGKGFQAIGSNSGNGGSGLINYIDGTRRSFGAGGGGGTYGSAYYAGAGETGVAGNGASGGAGGGATANTGGGGGGANGNPTGSAGGPGGSGVVYFRFKTGTVTVGPITGSLTYTSSTVTIKGVNYTVYRFTAGSGMITINSVS